MPGGCRDDVADVQSISSDSEVAGASTVRTRGQGRPPTTCEYVGLAKAKQKATEAEERARMANLAYSGKAPSKSLSTGILDPDNLLEIRRELAAIPAANLIERVDVAPRDVVYIADISRSIKGGFIRQPREATKTTKAVALELVERQSGGTWNWMLMTLDTLRLHA